MAVMMAAPATAQETFTKKELKKVKKMLKKPALRVALPSVMASDALCYDWLSAKRDKGPAVFMVGYDSIRLRHDENQWILERLEQALGDKEEMADYKERIKREEIRFDNFQRELSYVMANQAADERKAPSAPLTSLVYGVSGMVYYPDLPVEIRAVEGDSAMVKFGRQGQKKMVVKQMLDEMARIVVEERLYKLHPDYDFLTVSLPDIEQPLLLDGERWHLTLRYADGTTIESRGVLSPRHYLGRLLEYLDKNILPKRE